MEAGNIINIILNCKIGTISIPQYWFDYISITSNVFRFFAIERRNKLVNFFGGDTN
jgi:hypothetical protein